MIKCNNCYFYCSGKKSYIKMYITIDGIEQNIYFCDKKCLKESYIEIINKDDAE